MTQGEVRSLVKKAARNARTYYRKTDTAGEKLERELDRLVKRKTLIQASSLKSMEKLYYDYKNAMSALEHALADFISTANI